MVEGTFAGIHPSVWAAGVDNTSPVAVTLSDDCTSHSIVCVELSVPAVKATESIITAVVSLNLITYLMLSTIIDLAGTFTVSTPLFSLASLKALGATTFGLLKSL